MSEKRIYVIVAETVQNPVAHKYLSPTHYVLRPTVETKTVVQPIGRIGIQIGHVVSKMRMHRIVDMIQNSRAKNTLLWVGDMREQADEAITSISLSVPDSYQLEFYHSLLRKKFRIYSFFDTNEEYGVGAVKTAICTEPVEPSKLYGITDYLPLWGKHERNHETLGGTQRPHTPDQTF